MNINSIKDIVYSITTKSREHQEVNFEFIYNNYSENETQIKDDVILNRGLTYKDKFIRIEFENSVRDEGTNYVYNEFKENVLFSLENKDLYFLERELFNRLDNLTPGRMSLITDIKQGEFNKFTKLYNAEIGMLDEIEFRNYDNSSMISLKTDPDVLEAINNKTFPETFNYNNMLYYNSLVSNEKIEDERKNDTRSIEKFKSGELFPNLNHISESINVGSAQEYADSNNVFCGIYVEKFEVLKSIPDLKSIDDLKFLCSRFYTAGKSSKANDLVIANIEDEAINYGKTYRYVCYNTYLYTTVNPLDRFVLRHYLLCTHPYISNDIVCKENRNPPEPVGLTASFSKKENSLTLEWSEPNDYEGDIKGYQIFRRDSIEKPYVLIKQIEGHQKNDFYEFKENVLKENIEKIPGKINRHFVDEKFDKNKMSIYTVRSIDAHGMTSNYGNQIGIYYDMLRDETLVSLMGYSGANVSYPNETLLNKSFFHENNVDLVDNLPMVKKPKKISLYVTPDYANVSSDGRSQEVMGEEYQFTFINLNDFIYKTDKFSIVNFG
jgi:hypothetical protein